MVKYEYRAVRWQAHDIGTSAPNGVRPLGFQEGVEQLNKLGEEGWQVVGNSMTGHGAVYQYQTTILMREIPTKEGGKSGKKGDKLELGGKLEEIEV